MDIPSYLAENLAPTLLESWYGRSEVACGWWIGKILQLLNASALFVLRLLCTTDVLRE